MTYWLCITTQENWEIIKEKNLWGVPERHKNAISRVKPGDLLLIYVKQRGVGKEIEGPKVVAVYEAVSEVFRDSSRIFKSPPEMGNEAFPLRVRLRPVKIFEEPVDFKKLIPDLKFIENKRKWTGHLMGKAMREIPEEDFKLITGSSK
jgi:predicted RNA-binding protein